MQDFVDSLKEVQNINSPTKLLDRFNRHINYVRLSVTDRCDFRCVYCMAEDMTFLPRSQVLSLEELATVALAFREMGVESLRVTGGEPLIRKDVLQLFTKLGAMGFADLSLTTNGARLDRYAQSLVDCGVHRVNISLDTLHPLRFREMTRTGNLSDVIKGVDAAQTAGFKRIKINCVALKNYNADEINALTQFALERGIDISFIEEMPLGQIKSHSRKLEFISSAEIRDRLKQDFTLTPLQDQTGGPSRYWQVNNSPTRIGFISPHSENFCATCNRVRVSSEGRLLLCLGNEHSVDLRQILRSNSVGKTISELKTAIVQAMSIKPEKHDFTLDEAPQIVRFMNSTGG